MRLLFLTLLIVSLVFVQAADAQLSMDKPTTDIGMFHERTCKDGTCDLAIHSSPQRVYDEGRWKEAVNVSLKTDRWVIYTEIDEKTYINVTWCYGKVCYVCLSVDESMDKIPVPYYKDGIESSRISFTPNTNYCQITNATRLKFGEDSTTIFLDKDNDTYDSVGFKHSGDFVGGATITLQGWYDNGGLATKVIFEGNIAGKIPVSQQIDSAFIEFQVGDQLESGEAILACSHNVYHHPVYNINGEPWNESSFTWNLQPNATSFNATNISCVSYDNNSNLQYFNHSILDAVSYAYDNADENWTVIFDFFNINASEAPNSDEISFESRGSAGREWRTYITYSAASVSSTCQNLTASYTLENNVSSDGNCFNMTVDDIILDCDGYTINHSATSAGHGVIALDRDNLTMKNCVLVESGSTSAYATYFTRTNNSLITNNTILNGSYGGFANVDSFLNTYSYNNVNYTFGSPAIWVDTGSGNVTIHNNTLRSVGSGAVLVYAAEYNDIRHNVIRANITGGGSYPVVLGDGADYTVFNNNTVFAESDQIADILSDFMTFEDNTWYGTIGPSWFNDANNNTVLNDWLQISGASIVLKIAGYSNTFTDTTVNATTAGTIGLEITNGNDTTINNMSITGGSSYGINFLGNSYNVMIENSTITAPNSNDIYFTATADGNMTTVNCTYNESDVGFHASATGELYKRWYMRVNVTNSTGIAIDTASIAVDENSSGIWINSYALTSDANGLTEWNLGTENMKNVTDTYNSSIRFNVTKASYTTNTTIREISSNYVTFTIVMTAIDTTPPDLNFVSPTLDNNSYTDNVSWIYVNVSGYEALDECLLDNTTENQTMTEVGSDCNLNMTGLANMSSHYFRVWGNDTTGNLNVTEWRNITVNLTQYPQPQLNDINNCTSITSSGIWNLTTSISNHNADKCINITADDVVLDCGGRTIDGIDGDPSVGIYSEGKNNITVRDCVVSDWKYGINLINSSSHNITNNTLTSQTFDEINLENVSDAYIEDNYLYDGEYDPILLYKCDNVTVRRNIIYYYLTNVNGFYLYQTNNSNIYGNTLNYLSSRGVSFSKSSTTNTFENNTINYTVVGFYFNSGSNSNTITGNNITASTSYGFLINENNAGNLIYNNLLNNTDNVRFSGTNLTNDWNTTEQTGARIYSNGTNIGGNYYTNSTSSGYSDTCTDSDVDGFCDTSLTHVAGNIDYLPLSNKFGTTPDSTPPDIVFVDPSPDNETVTTNYTYINLTISEAGYCLLDWNGTNESMTNTTQAETYFVNKTTLNNGNYTFVSWCNDTIGNLNNSETRWVYINWTAPVVDTTPPDVNWIDPTTNGTETENNTYIQWNISSTENISIGFIEINGTNNTCTSFNASNESYCFYNQTGLSGFNTHCAFGFASDPSGNSNRTIQYICRTTNITAPTPGVAPEAGDVFYAFDHMLNYIFLLASEIMDAWYSDTVYGEMWNYSANATAWTFDIETQSVYYNLTNLSNGDLRGVSFTYNSQEEGGAFLTVEDAGLYKVDASLSFESMTNNQLFGFSIARNHNVENSRECYARRFVSNKATVGNMGIACLIDMEAGDTIAALVENEVSTGDIQIHAVNVNILKVGET